MTAKLCRRCVVEGVWRYDDEGNCLGKCECRDVEPEPTPEAKRDAGIDAAVGANPDAHAEGVRIIYETALGRAELSANEIRHRFDVNGIPRTVTAGAFRTAKANRWLRPCGQVESDDPATHAKLIDNYTSLIFRPEHRAAS